MKAVILAAGKSTRTYPLTCTKPKALLKVANKAILTHQLDALSEVITEVIVVVNYKKEMIKKAFGKKHKGITITYVEQKTTNGTASALLAAEKHISERFLTLCGDDYYDKKDIQKLCKEDYALLGSEIENPSQYGILEKDSKNQLTKIVEKPKVPKSNLANVGCYIFDKDIFPILKKCKKSKRQEYELTDAVSEFAKTKKMKVVIAKNWQPVAYPWHLLGINKKILKNLKFESKGKIEPRVTIHGAVQIGKGTIIKSGSYIEGPVSIGEDCKIGPNCYIRPYTTLGNKVKIGNAVEIKNCVVGDNTSIGHLSYVGDSVIGDNVNFGAGTIVANLRHDNGNVKSMGNKKLIDTGRRKLGTIIGDHVHTGIHTSIYPGRKLWPSTSTIPGEVVRKDKQ
jgi:UDP-N-acetylglucosamine diphosphorylase / glucose-1-phosphate thymidylyltransferase / UDP-N-acetylgalactosamine diphosphorylase / glucosamine-1-phosphate N-acetyltransferase / galactosamine-1-phosphate N-acetyltransferase